MPCKSPLLVLFVSHFLVCSRTLKITEIPITKTTSDYRDDVLQKLQDHEAITRYDDDSTEEGIQFTIHLDQKQMEDAEKFKGGVMGRFKLEGNVPTSNMVLFTQEGSIKKYTYVFYRKP